MLPSPGTQRRLVRTTLRYIPFKTTAARTSILNSYKHNRTILLINMSMLPGMYLKNNIRVINWTKQDFLKYVLNSLISDIEANKKS
jgi:hypothetical protein